MKPTPSSLSQRTIPNSTIIPIFFVLLCALVLSLGEIPSGYANAEPVTEPIPALFHPVYHGESSPPAASNIALTLSGSAQRQLLAEEKRAQAAAQRAKPAGFEDLELLDIVLVTTVDGGMHAVERSTGRKIWSQAGMVRSERGPGVVRNRYNESSGEAWYMLDPHDGQLYVYTDVDSTADGVLEKGMQKLPLKLEELIDFSPFTFPQSPSHVFIGSKSTSLLGIDLQTGQSVGSFGTRKASSLGICKPNGDGLQGIDEDECEGDIDERPEDLLYLGQTDHHLVVRSHTGAVIQDLHHMRVVPNAAHRDVADYWSKNGHVKGEVFIRPCRRFGSYTGSFNAAKAQAQAEYEDRWRVEVLYDGSIAGVVQGKGMKWVAKLDSIGVSVFDVLLSTVPGSKPILLPQPPAYLPTLMSEPQHNLQLMSLSPSAFVHEIPIGAEDAEGDIDSDMQGQGFFIMSSNNHPFVSYAPRTQDGSLLGGHEIREAVTERLPPLIDPAPESDDPGKDNKDESIPSNETHTGGAQTVRIDTTGWRRASSGWIVVSGIALALLLAIIILYRRKKSVATELQETEDSATADRKTLKTLPIAVDNDLPDIPSEEIEGDVKQQQAVGRNDSASSIENIDIKATPKKSNGRRRKRGKKNRGKRDDAGNDDENEDGDSEVEASLNDTAKGDMLVAPPTEVEQPEDITKNRDVTQIDSLSVTDSVIGFGSHGTVVYKGVFQGRAVAVKRLLRDFVSIASQEVALLQASDDHQNVIRYFYQEKRDNFLYIALELCSASLADIVENPSAHQDLVVGFDRKKSLYQISSGLRHLHNLKIIHRDLKPQNVLVSVNNKGVQRMLLSDFGLAKRLDHGQSSYAQTANHAVGSIGWRAPECLRGEVSLDDLFEDSSQSSLGNHLSGSSSRFSGDGSGTGRHARLTKAVDLFSLGCMYFYVMTGGCHPFGDRYEREINIVRGNIIGLDKLDSYGEDGYEAKVLIEKLLSPVSSERPDTSICMVHPMFWTAARRLAFLCDASDRFEIMEQQPPEPTLCQLESKATEVVGQSWQKKLDSVFLDNLGKHRKYDSRSLRDLLRALRNKKHHYQDLPDNVKPRLGTLPAGFLHYFTSRFPTLFTHVHSVVQGSKLRHESMFAAYFEQED